MNHFAVHLKLTQHCKLTIFQFLKKKEFRRKCVLTDHREKKTQEIQGHMG